MEQEDLNKDFYLKNVKLSGYKSIKNVDVDFERGLNIIIGKNASGKTNFMTCLFDSLSHTFDYLVDENELTYLGKYEIKLIVKKSLNFSREIGKQKGFFKNNAYKVNETIKESVLKNGVKLEKEVDQANSQDQLIAIGIPYYVTKIQYGIPNRYFSVSEPVNIKLGNTGRYLENIRSIYIENSLNFVRKIFGELISDYITLGQFTDDNSENYEAIKGSLNKIIELRGILKKLTPIKDIKYSSNFNLFFDQSQKEFTIDNLFVEFKVGDSWHPFSNLSDGTKRLFYIISEVYFSEKNSVVLIEEPELGIHPHQLHDLMTFLKEEAEDKQILITTHSPLVLNILNENELNHIIITKYENGETKLVHLDEKQKAKARKYMKDVDLSDYWVHSDLEK